MSMIYHGSFEVVKSPKIRTPNRSLDYGSGFYTTTSYEQAKRLVERRMKDKGMAVGYVNVTQDNLYLLLPLKIGWLVKWMVEDSGISITEAINCLYRSKLYKKLSTESTKYWHLGPVDLYEELKQGHFFCLLK